MRTDMTGPEDRSAKLAALSLDALETRNRILGEADRLFRVYGYSKTTVADIAEACRMSPANVYRFFASKSAINNAICERVIADDETALVGISRLPLPASERLTRMVIELNRRSMENFIENKKVHEMVTVALEERWEAIRAHIHRVSDLFATRNPGRHRQRRVSPAGRQARGRMRQHGHRAAASSHDAGAMHGRPREADAIRDGGLHHQSPEIATSAQALRGVHVMRLESDKNQISSVNNGYLRCPHAVLPWRWWPCWPAARARRPSRK